LRAYKTKNYKIMSKTYKAQLPVPVTDKENPESGVKMIDERNVRLFHDDTFPSFFRRMDFSPDGELLVIPSGVLEIDGETRMKNCTYVFSRTNLSKYDYFSTYKKIIEK
jgi:chromatin assembly factor 1 subunit B